MSPREQPDRMSPLEQQRRDFMADCPALYDYIVARATAKALDSAGDVASGAADQYGAANRVYSMAAQAKSDYERMLHENP